MSIVPFFLILPLTSAFLIPLTGKRAKKTGDALLCSAAFLLAALSLASAFFVSSHKAIAFRVGGWPPPAGIPMIIDGLSAFMLVIVNSVAFLIAVYSTVYMKGYTDKWKFSSLFMLMLTGFNGVLISGDIFNLYIFMEIAAIAGYFLVAFGTEAEELEAAFKYAVMGAVASIFILIGIAFLYSYTSTLNMADMGMLLAGKNTVNLVRFVSVLFLMGFGLKSALVPFHAWLPYAHSSAPAPVSAMLSGVSIKVLGVYALARIFFNVFGMSATVSSILIILAVISMVAGSVLAFGQSDIKRLFAYSSISQIGYIVLALAIATPLSLLGALFHLLNHSVFKSLLFLDSGSIESTFGTRDLGKIRGIISRSPVTGYTTLIGALSICGMPPFGGFWSKLIIILACLQAGHPFLALVAVIVSLMTITYYFNALAPALFEGRDIVANKKPLKTAPLMAIPMILLAVASVAAGWILLPNAGHTVLSGAVNVLVRGADYLQYAAGAFK